MVDFLPYIYIYIYIVYIYRYIYIYVGQLLFVEFLIAFPFLEMKHVYYIWPKLKGRTNPLKKPAGRKLLVSLCTE